MPRRQSRALLTAAVLLSWACDEENLVPVRVPPDQTDTFEQITSAEVDILWVVDNSQSMRDEQELLADNFDRFIRNLTTCVGTGFEDDICDFATSTCQASGRACNPPNYHVGVVSTDPRDEGRLVGVGVCAPASGVPPANGQIRYCIPGPTACGPDGDDPAVDPENTVCDLQTPLRFVDPLTANANAAFGRMVRFDLAGGQGAREEGIASAARALGIGFVFEEGAVTSSIAAPPENEGFLRPSAPLFIIFVSDEDDSSFGPVPAHYRRFEQLKGGGNDNLVSVSAIVGDPDPDGPDPREVGGCELETREGSLAQEGPRYVELAMYSRAVSTDIPLCDGARLPCPSDQVCRTPLSDLPGVCAPSTCEDSDECTSLRCGDGPCLSCVEGTCQAQGPRLLSLLQQSGVFQSICSEDYGPVLDQLGFDAAGLTRRFDLSRFPDCFRQVPCCAADTPDESCDAEAPICVRIDDEVIPNDRAQGWVFDLGANAVFFDGDVIPPPGAEVSVRYNFVNTDRSQGCGGL